MATVTFNHTAHKELWDWISKNICNIDYDVEKWPCWKENGGKYDRPVNNCFACEYAIKADEGRFTMAQYCKYDYDYEEGCGCPLENFNCFIDDSLWTAFYELSADDCTKEGATKVAEQIRDTLVKAGVKCI